MPLFLGDVFKDVLDFRMWTVIYNKYGYPLIPTDLALHVAVFIKWAFCKEE